MARKRTYNTIRTDTIEIEIALATARRDYDAADVWRKVARKVNAPIDEAVITAEIEKYRRYIDSN